MPGVLHKESGLRVVLKWKIYRPDSVIAAVIPLHMMQNFGIRYLMFCVSLIAACVAVWQYSKATPNPANGVDYSFLINFRPFGLIGAISIFMHVACDAIGLRSLVRWLVAILVPSVAMLGWWFWWVAGIKQSGVHHPITIRPTEVLILNLVTFTIGFAVVSFVLSFARSWLNRTPLENQPDSVG